MARRCCAVVQASIYSAEVHAALTPKGTWQWMEAHSPFMDPFRRERRVSSSSNARKRAKWRGSMPTNPLDGPATATPWYPPWRELSAHLFDTSVRESSISMTGWRTRSICPRGTIGNKRHALSLCKFCNNPETQQYISVACSYPPLIETRLVHRRRIDEFFLFYRHHHLPLKHKWRIICGPARRLDGRWTPLLLSSLLSGDHGLPIPQSDYKAALTSLQRLTGTLRLPSVHYLEYVTQNFSP